MYNATQLPPTITVKDPDTRQFLDSLVNVLDLRSGNTDKNSKDRFITAGDLQSAISGGTSYPSAPGVPDSVTSAVNDLRNNLQQSLITQLLEQPLRLIDIGPIQSRIDASLQAAQAGINSVSNALTTSTESLTKQIDSAVSRIGSAEAAILSEATTRATADEATTTSLNAAISRIGASESAIVSEANTRSYKDNALAQAINTMWAVIGGSEAVIQDGSLAQISPASVYATKWTQLQSAIKDPATGAYVSSAQLRTDMETIATRTGSLEARYTVKVDLNGYITGFGLAATANNGVATSEFQVRADRFSIVSPTGTNQAATIMTNNTIKVYDESGILRVKIGNLSA